MQAPSPTAKSNKLTPKQQEELRSMFDCYAKDKKSMTKEELYQMFSDIGFTPTTSQKEKYEKLFAVRPEISCSEFMSIFKIKSDDLPYSKTEILNAFKVYYSRFLLLYSFCAKNILSHIILIRADCRMCCWKWNYRPKM